MFVIVGEEEEEEGCLDDEDDGDQLPKINETSGKYERYERYDKTWNVKNISLNQVKILQGVIKGMPRKQFIKLILVTMRRTWGGNCIKYAGLRGLVRDWGIWEGTSKRPAEKKDPLQPEYPSCPWKRYHMEKLEADISGWHDTEETIWPLMWESIKKIEADRAAIVVVNETASTTDRHISQGAEDTLTSSSASSSSSHPIPDNDAPANETASTTDRHISQGAEDTLTSSSASSSSSHPIPDNDAPANGDCENGSGGGEGVAQFGVNSSLAGKFPFPFNMICRPSICRPSLCSP